MQRKEIIVRHHNKEDISGILALLVKCFPAAWGELVALGRKETWYNSDSTIAVCEGKIVGNCGLLRFPVMLNGKTVTGANLGSVAVDPDYRGMGIAKKMINEIIKTALGEKIFFSALFTDTPGVYENSGWKSFKMADSIRLELPDVQTKTSEIPFSKPDDELLEKIAGIYENSFSFNGKVKRDISYWKGHILSALLRKQSWVVKYKSGIPAAYAILCGDEKDFTLAEAYSLNDDMTVLKSLLDDIVSISKGKITCCLPPTHPMRLLISENYFIFANPVKYDNIMINIIDHALPQADSLKECASKGEFYWAYADKF